MISKRTALAALVVLSASAPAHAATERVLYSFSDGPDGGRPVASVTVDGILYGTTQIGGEFGLGTIFALNPNTGVETVLHSFGNGTDAASPQAGLINVNGTLYGTTASGGAYGSGTIFSVPPNTKKENVLYSFCREQNCADGQGPYSNLISLNGVLYGTTSAGGANCPNYREGACGTVFSLDPGTGVETVLYSFCSQANCTDGAIPVAGLIDVKGILYGTTEYGGDMSCGGGCGTAFSFDPATGVEAVLHAFTNNDGDGIYPLASLIDVKGKLYGTTMYGGDYEGVVFSVDRRTGAETVLYAFCTQHDCTDDGRQPQANLVNVAGVLYGTTFYGGGQANGGIVFSIKIRSGKETIVHSFCSENQCADGMGPVAGLISINGTLYGTASSGGTSEPIYTCDSGRYNCGTVFAITP